jgi:hypothetical protein
LHIWVVILAAAVLTATVKANDLPDWLVKRPGQYTPQPASPPGGMPDWLYKAPAGQQSRSVAPSANEIPGWLVNAPGQQRPPAPAAQQPEIPDWLVRAPGLQRPPAPAAPQPELPSWLVRAPLVQRPNPAVLAAAPEFPDWLVRTPAPQRNLLAVRQGLGNGTSYAAAPTSSRMPAYVGPRGSAAEVSRLEPSRELVERTASPDLEPGDDDENAPFHLASFAKQDQENSRTADGQQTYGERPPTTNNNLQFLRRESVLLEAGDWQFDAGGVYTLFDNDVPIPIFENGTLTNVVEGLQRRRLLYVPFAARYGLTDRCQLFAFLPVGWENTQFSTIGADDYSNRGGFGDLTAGSSLLLCEGCGGYSPEAILNLAFTAPTGNFTSPIFGLVPGSALAQGFWALQAQMIFINRYDPIVVFYGLGYRHLFERSFDGVAFQPGEQIGYQMGVGFAVNDRVTLSTAFQGFYITDTYLNGQRLPGSILEPLSLRFAATISRKTRILEPFALIGMTEEAPAAQIGMIITFR